VHNCFSRTPPENSGGTENLAEKSGPDGKIFFAICTNIVYDIRSGYRKLTSGLVTVYSTSMSVLCLRGPCQQLLAFQIKNRAQYVEPFFDEIFLSMFIFCGQVEKIFFFSSTVPCRYSAKLSWPWNPFALLINIYIIFVHYYSSFKSFEYRMGCLDTKLFVAISHCSTSTCLCCMTI
jgi:hypothetical protein